MKPSTDTNILSIQQVGAAYDDLSTMFKADPSITITRQILGPSKAALNICVEEEGRIADIDNKVFTYINAMFCVDTPANVTVELGGKGREMAD
ncbi:MAG: hypothetical protein C0436_01290 [Alphaproteobacteria bacterium]|nr:hypothetical protein [Alphaproteobacteria bacterium]